jgi:hypothetical protein
MNLQLKLSVVVLYPSCIFSFKTWLFCNWSLQVVFAPWVATQLATKDFFELQVKSQLEVCFWFLRTSVATWVVIEVGRCQLLLHFCPSLHLQLNLQLKLSCNLSLQFCNLGCKSSCNKWVLSCNMTCNRRFCKFTCNLSCKSSRNLMCGFWKLQLQLES